MDSDLSVQEITIRTKTTFANVYNLLRSGRLAGRKIDGQWRVPRAAVDAYLERRSRRYVATAGER